MLRHVLILAIFLSVTPVRAMEVTYSRVRYDPVHGFKVGVETRLKGNGGSFTPRDTKSVRMAGICEKTLLADDQAFSFKRMLEIGYITQVEYDFYTKLSSALDPEQVTFFHQYRKYTKEEVAKLSPEEVKKIERLMESRLTGFVEVEAVDPMAKGGMAQFFNNIQKAVQTPVFLVKDASMFLVKGQGWDPYLKRRIYKLPWMKEAEFSHAVDLSRMEYPLIWELGRAAVIDDGSLPDMVRMAIAEMAEEARIYGIDPEKTRVFAHAKDKSHRELYTLAYGFKLFATSSKNPDDTVLIATLAELLRRYPDEKSVAAIGALKDAAGGLLTSDGAARVQSRFKSELYQAVDFKEGSAFQSKPIILMNDLFEMGGFVAETMVDNGIKMGPGGRPTEAMQGLYRVLSQFGSDQIAAPESMIIDPLLRVRMRNSPQKALRIYNLDPAATKEDPDLLYRVLGGIRNFYRKKVEGVYRKFGNGVSFPEPHYAIATSSEEIRKAAEAMGARVEMQRMIGEEVVKSSRVEIDGSNKLNLDIALGDSYLLHFTDTQIMQLLSRRPGMEKETEDLFKVGKWQEALQLWSGPYR